MLSRLDMLNTNGQVFRDFARIAPKWAELYQTYKFSVLQNGVFCREDLCKTADENEFPMKNGSRARDESLNIQDSACCVLGESHGFTGCMYDNCEVCDELSYDFCADEVLNGVVDEKRSIEKFETAIKDLVKHFKKEHKKLFNAKINVKRVQS